VCVSVCVYERERERERERADDCRGQCVRRDERLNVTGIKTATVSITVSFSVDALCPLMMFM